MTLLLVVFQAHFIVNSIFEGLIWFFLPVCLVITNDIFAYICGMIWGRTPLIRLSPKKTVEGFIGGWICTIIIGGGIAYVLTKFKYMICPVTVPPPLSSLTTGPRRLSLVWSGLPTQPSLHPPRIQSAPLPNHFVRKNIPHPRLSYRCSNSIPHPRPRDIRLPHRTLWGVLRQWTQARIQN
jgi:Cytidylyltransferase family